MPGILYIISAPSGAGKTSLLNRVLQNQLICNIQLSISYTTRKIRSGEFNKEHYFFVSQEKFKNMIENDFFLEYAKVFGHYYGTSKKIIENILSSGVDVLLDIDWQGAQQIRKKYSNSCSIFIVPPSMKELSRRLHSRKKESKRIIENRMLQAELEIMHYIEYDYLIVNDCFNSALNDLKSVVESERLRIDKNNKMYHNIFISNLLNNF
ncbi:MAG: guanylate kinase [Candidatus Westeberhardia cardiocondylae]|nr:guanylate kinase [Candidatus Westeberhardia cardiocondylae]